MKVEFKQFNEHGPEELAHWVVEVGSIWTLFSTFFESNQQSNGEEKLKMTITLSFFVMILPNCLQRQLSFDYPPPPSLPLF